MIWTNKADYPPESVVTIYGTGFAPSSSVTLTATNPDGSTYSWTVSSNSTGGFTTPYTPVVVGRNYSVSATDGTNTATTTFTDQTDHCAASPVAPGFHYADCGGENTTVSVIDNEDNAIFDVKAAGSGNLTVPFEISRALNSITGYVYSVDGTIKYNITGTAYLDNQTTISDLLAGMHSTYTFTGKGSSDNITLTGGLTSDMYSIVASGVNNSVTINEGLGNSTYSIVLGQAGAIAMTTINGTSVANTYNIVFGGGATSSAPVSHGNTTSPSSAKSTSLAPEGILGLSQLSYIYVCDNVVCNVSYSNDADGASMTVNATNSNSTYATPSTFYLQGSGDSDSFSFYGPVKTTSLYEVFTATGTGLGDFFTVLDGGVGANTISLIGGNSSTFVINGGNGSNSFNMIGGYSSTVVIDAGPSFRSSTTPTPQSYSVNVGPDSSIYVTGGSGTNEYTVTM
jgi:hypothetical protein